MLLCVNALRPLARLVAHTCLPNPPPCVPQVVEVEADPMPLGPGNPHGVGFDITQRVLQRESEAQRMCAPERSRVWKVGRGMGGALEHHTMGCTDMHALLRWRTCVN